MIFTDVLWKLSTAFQSIKSRDQYVFIPLQLRTMDELLMISLGSTKIYQKLSQFCSIETNFPRVFYFILFYFFWLFPFSIHWTSEATGGPFIGRTLIHGALRKEQSANAPWRTNSPLSVAKKIGQNQIQSISRAPSPFAIATAKCSPISAINYSFPIWNCRFEKAVNISQLNRRK